MIKDEEMKIFQMISSAGTAKSAYMEALVKAKSARFEEAKELIIQGDECYRECHKIHADLLREDIESLDCKVRLCLVHAEDQMMSVENTKILVEEIIDLYQIITKMSQGIPY